MHNISFALINDLFYSDNYFWICFPPSAFVSAAVNFCFVSDTVSFAKITELSSFLNCRHH